MHSKQALQQMENYRRLVAQQAWRTWRQLPAHARVWIGIDDIIQRGMFVTYDFLARQYDPSKSKEPITCLYHKLHNVFLYEYISVHCAWKRNGMDKKDGKVIPIKVQSLQALQDRYRDDGKATLDDVIGTIPELVTTEEFMILNMTTECFVVPALSKVYQQSSPKLQHEIINWFCHKSLKVHTKSKPFQKLVTEFRELCQKEHVYCDDCLHLVRSPKCLDSLSRELLHIPYNLDDPTPGLRSMA